MRSLATRFGDELRGLMDAAGLSYRKLGELAGVSASHVCSVANGRRGYKATDSLIEAVANGLGVPPSTFTDYRRRRVIEQLAGEHLDALFRQ